jgi:hypothetical protein
MRPFARRMARHGSSLMSRAFAHGSLLSSDKRDGGACIGEMAQKVSGWTSQHALDGLEFCSGENLSQFNGGTSHLISKRWDGRTTPPENAGTPAGTMWALDALELWEEGATHTLLLLELESMLQSPVP